ncbi:MAG: hypothetical protein RR313_02760 [Anaerovoracaceae bacterium]
MKRVRVLIAVCMILVLGSSMVYAGTSYGRFSTTVGDMNGNGYTAYQTKALTGAEGSLDCDYVGGDYTVDARMQSEPGIIGAWTRNVTDNTTYALGSHSLQSKGERIRIQFSNDLTTLVDVQVEGRWKSN